MPADRATPWSPTTAQEALLRVARQLANRLSHAACDDHPSGTPDPGCPYCADRAAYTAWLAFVDEHGAGVGLTRPADPFAGAEMVPLHELIRRHKAGEPAFRAATPAPETGGPA